MADDWLCSDAFTKRETAAEEMYIKQEEKAKLQAIKAKLQQQQQHVNELIKHMYVGSMASFTAAEIDNGSQRRRYQGGLRPGRATTLNVHTRKEYTWERR
jgi:hypothetical protein